MKFFRIYVNEEIRDQTLDVVKSFSNDILIEEVEDDSIGITIETEEPEADELYESLLEELNRQNLQPLRA